MSAAEQAGPIIQNGQGFAKRILGGQTLAQNLHFVVIAYRGREKRERKEKCPQRSLRGGFSRAFLSFLACNRPEGRFWRGGHSPTLRREGGSERRLPGFKSAIQGIGGNRGGGSPLGYFPPFVPNSQSTDTP